MEKSVGVNRRELEEKIVRMEQLVAALDAMGQVTRPDGDVGQCASEMENVNSEINGLKAVMRELIEKTITYLRGVIEAYTQKDAEEAREYGQNQTVYETGV